MEVDSAGVVDWIRRYFPAAIRTVGGRSPHGGRGEGKGGGGDGWECPTGNTPLQLATVDLLVIDLSFAFRSGLAQPADRPAAPGAEAVGEAAAAYLDMVVEALEPRVGVVVLMDGGSAPGQMVALRQAAMIGRAYRDERVEVEKSVIEDLAKAMGWDVSEFPRDAAERLVPAVSLLPGTPLTERVAAQVAAHIEKRCGPGGAWAGLTFVFSPPNDLGDGFQKAAALIRRFGGGHHEGSVAWGGGGEGKLPHLAVLCDAELLTAFILLLPVHRLTVLVHRGNDGEGGRGAGRRRGAGQVMKPWGDRGDGGRYSMGGDGVAKSMGRLLGLDASGVRAELATWLEGQLTGSIERVGFAGGSDVRGDDEAVRGVEEGEGGVGIGRREKGECADPRGDRGVEVTYLNIMRMWRDVAVLLLMAGAGKSSVGLPPLPTVMISRGLPPSADELDGERGGIAGLVELYAMFQRDHTSGWFHFVGDDSSFLPDRLSAFVGYVAMRETCLYAAFSARLEVLWQQRASTNVCEDGEDSMGHTGRMPDPPAVSAPPDAALHKLQRLLHWHVAMRVAAGDLSAAQPSPWRRPVGETTTVPRFVRTAPSVLHEHVRLGEGDYRTRYYNQFFPSPPQATSCRNTDEARVSISSITGGGNAAAAAGRAYVDALGDAIRHLLLGVKAAAIRSYPHPMAPLVVDIAAALVEGWQEVRMEGTRDSSRGPDAVEGGTRDVAAVDCGDGAYLSPFVQLLCVLPPQDAAACLPPHLSLALTDVSRSPLAQWAARDKSNPVIPGGGGVASSEGSSMRVLVPPLSSCAAVVAAAEGARGPSVSDTAVRKDSDAHLVADERARNERLPCLVWLAHPGSTPRHRALATLLADANGRSGVGEGLAAVSSPGTVSTRDDMVSWVAEALRAWYRATVGTRDGRPRRQRCSDSNGNGEIADDTNRNSRMMRGASSGLQESEGPSIPGRGGVVLTLDNLARMGLGVEDMSRFAERNVDFSEAEDRRQGLVGEQRTGGDDLDDRGASSRQDEEAQLAQAMELSAREALVAAAADSRRSSLRAPDNGVQIGEAPRMGEGRHAQDRDRGRAIPRAGMEEAEAARLVDALMEMGYGMEQAIEAARGGGDVEAAILRVEALKSDIVAELVSMGFPAPDADAAVSGTDGAASVAEALKRMSVGA